MSEIAKAYVQIIPSAQGIKENLAKVMDGDSKDAGEKSGLNIVGAIKGAIAAAGIGKAVKSALDEGSNLQQQIGGVETLYKESADTMKNYANEAYKSAGMSASKYMETSTSFAAALLQGVGGDTKKAAEAANTAIIDMSDNANKMGTSMDSIQMAYNGFAKNNYTMLDNLKLGYGGTKTEMERLLADAQKISGVKYDMSNLSDVYSAIHVVQQKLDITGTTAREAATTFEGSFNMMKASVSNLAGYMALGGTDLTPYLKNLVSSVATFLFGNFLPMVGNVAKGAVQVLGDGLLLISQNSGKMLAAAVELANNFITGIVNAAPQMLLAATNWITQFINGFSQMDIAESASQVKAHILELFNFGDGDSANLFITAGNLLISFSSGILQQASTLLASVGNAIIEGLTNGINLAAQILIPPLTDGTILYFINGVLTAAQNLVQLGVSLIQSLTASIQLAAPNLANTAGELMGAFISFLAQALPQIVVAGNNIITTLYNALVQGAVSLIEAGLTIIKGLMSGVSSALPQLGTAAAQIIATIVSGLMERAATAYTAMYEIVRKILETIAQVLPQFIQAAVSMINNLGKGLGDAAPGLMQKMVQVGLQMVAAILQNLPGILAAGAKIIGELIVGILSVTAALLGAVANLGAGIVKGFLSLGVQLLAAGAQIIIQFVNGIVSKSVEVTNSITNLGKNIVDTVKNINLVDIGKNIIQGLANGIRSGISGVANAIRDAAVGAVNAAKNSLDIHSPSGVMRDQIGRYIPEGIAVGIEANADAINFDSINNRVMAQARSTLAIQPQKNISGNLQLQSLEGMAVYLDGERVGKVTSQRVNRELAHIGDLERRGAV